MPGSQRAADQAGQVVVVQCDFTIEMVQRDTVLVIVIYGQLVYVSMYNYMYISYVYILCIYIYDHISFYMMLDTALRYVVPIEC